MKIIILLLLGIGHCEFHPHRWNYGVQPISNTEIRPLKKYVQLGHINIGVLTSMTTMGLDNICTDPSDYHPFQYYPDVVAYAVEQINRHHPLPHNLTLGFVILDDCSNENVAVSQATTFLPHASCPGTSATYDVVAVTGAQFSTVATQVATVLGLSRIPHVCSHSTTDDFSDKERYPYLVRVVPAKRQQAAVMAYLAASNNWTFISVIFQDKDTTHIPLRRQFEAKGICVAAYYMIPRTVHNEEVEAAAKHLVKQRGNSRVVVLILSPAVAHRIVKATDRLLPENTFLWINLNGWSPGALNLSNTGSFLRGSLLISYLPASVPGFDDWFRQLTPSKTSNPWFHDYWEKLFNCSLDNKTCGNDLNLTDAFVPVKDHSNYMGYIADAVYIIANATARVLHNYENLTASEARACVTGPRLLSELMATRQGGYSGWLELDSTGDRHVPYIVSQLKPNDTAQTMFVPVMKFDPSTGQTTHLHEMSWGHVRLRPGSATLESVCSDPCERSEVHVTYDVTCCWICIPCEMNENTVDNDTRCNICPEFTWPDRVRRECLPITPIVISFTTFSGSVMMAFVTFGLISCLLVSIFYFQNRNHRIIKASSLGLSYLILFSITMGYTTNIIFLGAPTNVTCKIGFLLLGMSHSLIYGPLLVRVQWVYRLFEASKKTTRRPMMSQVHHQFIFCIVIVAVQVTLVMTPTLGTTRKWHKMSQESRKKPYVEHTCVFPYESVLAVYIYNLMLIFACGIIAFKARNLPNNYNESTFICICASVTFVIALGFFPTYQESHSISRFTSLMVMVILNQSVVFVTIFIPKVHAVVTMKEGTATSFSFSFSYSRRRHCVRTDPYVLHNICQADD